MAQEEKKHLEQDPEQNQNSEPESAKESTAALFIKVGIVILSMIMIVGLGIKIIPDAVTVSNIGTKRDLPIYCVNTKEKKLALTFDTAGNNQDIKRILEILEKTNSKATFFVTGSWAEEYPEDLKAIAAAGHDLGNHSEKHKRMSQMSKEQCIEDIMSVHEKVKNAAGIEMKLFRAPYGEFSNTLVGAAREIGYYAIQWDIDSEDWKDYGVKAIVDKTINHKKLGNGSIILFNTGTKYTAEALEHVISGLQEKGYELVPVSELIYTGRYVVDRTGRQLER
jgi:polysaccharide deacetylase family sporulation protein PdaB